jgi:hypothetical protein
VVTVAAVMAFVTGAVVILGTLLIDPFGLLSLFDTLRIGHVATDAWDVEEGVLALVRLALGALFIWGGIAALKGRTRTVLVVVSVIEAIFSLFLGAFFFLRVVGWVFLPLVFLELVFVGSILILILQPQSRDFFRARGKTAN